MKIRNLTILPLCLALLPCSVQAEEPVDAVEMEKEYALSSEVNEELRAQIPGRAEKAQAATERLLEILRGIKDKETADAAAPQIAPAIKEATEAMNSAMELYADFWNCGDYEGARMLQDACDSTYLVASEIEGIVNAMANDAPAFHGSEALEKAFFTHKNNVKITEVTEEQTEVTMKLMDEAIATLEEMKALLDSVKDAESADAAARPAVAYVTELTERWEKLMEWLDEIEAPRTYGAFIMSRYEEKLQVREEIRQRMQELSELDPPFYGSEALQSALMGDEEAQQDVIEADKLAKMLKAADNAARGIESLVAGFDKEAGTEGIAEEVAGSCMNLFMALHRAETEAATPEGKRYAEALPQLHAMVDRVLQLDTKGDDLLKTAMYGLAYLQAHRGDPEQVEKFVHYVLFSGYGVPTCVYDEDGVILIPDRELADEAAELIAAWIADYHEETAGAQGLDLDAVNTWVKLASSETAPEFEAKLRDLARKCETMDPPYFGSEALRNALKKLDEPQKKEE